ncbi:twin-arginine translocase subunit TatC [Desulfogranum marinum]|uniref:twin-arginine translocase subunit TatC n=1 Tax=Desulfogranum marinum TaxID=453220 RepID=UPI0019647F31|nr:twin-arginine translocase subunit TatC [Desulfogranum marinum]MBM9513552.1 twin-arginine translocase subunit TatC [Desulfogranum marinum]
MITAFDHFRPHHEELRKRLIRIISAVFLCTLVAYLGKDYIAAFCMQPLFTAAPELEKLVYTKLTEAFISYIKLSLLAGILFSFPYILFQMWMFISPGLLAGEKKAARLIVLWATFLFLGGACFSFFIALPKILSFFMSYAGPNLTPMPKFGLYLTFVGRMVLAFGIAFEIPFLMVMAIRTGIVAPHYFFNKRTWFYIAIMVLSFLLATGELTATVLLCLPLFLLYEAGILAGRVFKGKSKPTSSK